MTRVRSRPLWLAVALVVACEARPDPVPTDWPFALDAEPVRGDSAMVVSTDAYASAVGIEILRAGGNVVDAAVATSFALAVVNPEAGNIGGGGFMVLRFADGSIDAIDYRETAPLAAHRDMFLDANGQLTDDVLVGHRAVAVPGTVAGLWAAHQRYGLLAWSRVVEPAIELAEGFEIRERQAVFFEANEEELRLYATTEATFLPEGRPPQVGDHFAQLELAATLRRIRDSGSEDFYRGVTADLIVQEMEHGGGLITHEDLAAYEAHWREPIVFEYRDHTIISMAPVSSGGATLAAMSNILEGFDLQALGWHTPEAIHVVAEAWKRAYADRNAYLADPAFVRMPVTHMISDEYAADRRRTIQPTRATPAKDIGPGLGVPEREQNTTHFSVVDTEGNAAAVTTTVNSWFGSKVTVTGGGFVLNNEMDDFAAQPGAPNQFGLVQGENNAIEPGKRMLSAMTPTIVLDPDGALFLVLGSPGGSTIITNVFQNLSNVVDYGMPLTRAVAAPRLHHQHLPDRLQYERGGLLPETLRTLEAMGHVVEERYDLDEPYPYIGDLHAIHVTPDGMVEGVADPRRGGAAIGF